MFTGAASRLPAPPLTGGALKVETISNVAVFSTATEFSIATATVDFAGPEIETTYVLNVGVLTGPGSAVDVTLNQVLYTCRGPYD